METSIAEKFIECFDLRLLWKMPFFSTRSIMCITSVTKSTLKKYTKFRSEILEFLRCKNPLIHFEHTDNYEQQLLNERALVDNTRALLLSISTANMSRDWINKHRRDIIMLVKTMKFEFKINIMNRLLFNRNMLFFPYHGMEHDIKSEYINVPNDPDIKRWLLLDSSMEKMTNPTLWDKFTIFTKEYMVHALFMFYAKHKPNSEYTKILTIDALSGYGYDTILSNYSKLVLDSIVFVHKGANNGIMYRDLAEQVINDFLINANDYEIRRLLNHEDMCKLIRTLSYPNYSTAVLRCMSTNYNLIHTMVEKLVDNYTLAKFCNYMMDDGVSDTLFKVLIDVAPRDLTFRSNGFDRGLVSKEKLKIYDSVYPK